MYHNISNMYGKMPYSNNLLCVILLYLCELYIWYTFISSSLLRYRNDDVRQKTDVYTGPKDLKIVFKTVPQLVKLSNKNK